MLRRTTCPVKPTRMAPRSRDRFGFGVLATHPSHRLPVLISDLDWLAAQNGAEPDWDELARADAMLERYTNGHCL